MALKISSNLVEKIHSSTKFKDYRACEQALYADSMEESEKMLGYTLEEWYQNKIRNAPFWEKDTAFRNRRDFLEKVLKEYKRKFIIEELGRFDNCDYPNENDYEDYKTLGNTYLKKVQKYFGTEKRIDYTIMMCLSNFGTFDNEFIKRFAAIKEILKDFHRREDHFRWWYGNFDVDIDNEKFPQIIDAYKFCIDNNININIRIFFPREFVRINGVNGGFSIGDDNILIRMGDEKKFHALYSTYKFDSNSFAVFESYLEFCKAKHEKYVRGSIIGLNKRAESRKFDINCGELIRVNEYFEFHMYTHSSLTLPSSVNEIAERAFHEMHSLTKVTLPKSLKIINEHAFYGCPQITTVHIPKNVSYIHPNAVFACERFENFEVDKQNKKYSAIDGVLYSKRKTSLIAFPEAKNVKEFKIPDSVHVIESLSMPMYYVKKLIVGDNVKEIKNDACQFFEKSAKVVIPESVKKIGKNAFGGKVTIIAKEGSYAAEWAKAHKYKLVTE